MIQSGVCLHELSFSLSSVKFTIIFLITSFLASMLSKGQLRELWKALSSNEVAGFEKLTEFLTKVSKEIKHSRTQALNVEQTLKG